MLGRYGVALTTALVAGLLLPALLTGCQKTSQQAPASSPQTATPVANTQAPVTGAAATKAPANIGNAKNEKGEYICPVLKEPVTKLDPALSSEYKGKVYYFCCAMCKPKFDADPTKYVR